jgi:hypothetical protein
VKIVIVLFALAIGVTSLEARANAAREFGPYISAGLTRNMAGVTQPGVNASLDGWGESGELGFDIPFTETFGFTLGAELAQRELRNSTTSSSYLDDTKINSRAARGSFFYKSFYLGGSYQQAGIDLVTVSANSGASSAHLDLTGASYFAGYSITYKNLLRANIEGESAHYASTGFNYTDYSVGLKFQILISGFLDRN